MAVVIACPHCQSKLKLKDESALGKTVRCPTCEETFSAADRGAPKTTASAAKAPTDASKSAAMKKKAKAKPAEEAPAEPDEWDLGDLGELAPASRSKSAKSPPSVVGKKPKRRVPDDDGKQSLRDSDGEYPLWLHSLMMIGSGLVGGLIAMGLWAALIAWLGFGRGWGAILVGVLVGIGVRVGASRRDYGWGPAITASVIALVAMFAGKYIGYRVIAAQDAREAKQLQSKMVASMKHENWNISVIAQEMSEKADEAGEPWDFSTVQIDDDDDFVGDETDPERIPKHYPPKLWEAASTKWKEMPEDEKATRRKKVEGEIAQLEAAPDDRFDHTIFWPFDIVWGIFCVSSAFRIAAGMDDDN